MHYPLFHHSNTTINLIPAIRWMEPEQSYSRRIIMKNFRWIIFTICLGLIMESASLANTLPEGFVYVKEIIPGIKLEMRYYTEDNFVGQRIDGYEKPRCILTKQAAAALKKVQEELKTFGLELKIFDAYRPQQAVDHFVRWAKDLGDVKMKAKYYPDVDKKNLFRDGYIAAKSGHSRGSTVDVTIISLDSKKTLELDMGTGFDFFGPLSWPDSKAVKPDQRAHRMLLQTLMTKHGFKPLQEEWWHFTLKDEPFPDTYFDFPIK
jgi:zinc D-Ala-D-Ala dipeptidase